MASIVGKNFQALTQAKRIAEKRMAANVLQSDLVDRCGEELLKKTDKSYKDNQFAYLTNENFLINSGKIARAAYINAGLIKEKRS